MSTFETQNILLEVDVRKSKYITRSQLSEVKIYYRKFPSWSQNIISEIDFQKSKYIAGQFSKVKNYYQKSTSESQKYIIGSRLSKIKKYYWSQLSKVKIYYREAHSRTSCIATPHRVVRCRNGWGVWTSQHTLLLSSLPGSTGGIPPPWRTGCC